MGFGSRIIFELICQNINNPQNYEWYDTLEECIKKECKQKLAKYSLSQEDIEDIIQNVQLKVFKSLSTFYCNELSTHSEQQREAWLNRIIQNTVTDFFRTAKSDTEIISIDDADNPVDISSGFDIEEKNVAKAQLFEMLHHVCEVNTTPDKMMSFLLNKMAAVFYKKSGKPKDIENSYYGRTLLEVYQELQKQLRLLLGYEVPKEILLPLWEKVESHQDQLYLRKASQISTDTNWIQRKINQ